MTETMPEPVEEGPQTVEFTVRVRSLGKPDIVRRSVEKALCRALHKAFGIDHVDVEAEGALLIFDPTAQNAGDDVLVSAEPLPRMPVAETFGGRSATREIPGQVVRHVRARDGNLDVQVRLALDSDRQLLPAWTHVLVVPQ